MPDKLLSADPKAGQLLSADPNAAAPPATEAAPASEHPFVNTIATIAGVSMPVMRNLLEHLATNPNVPKMAASVGRLIGGASPVIGGAATLGPGGALLGVGSVAKGAWAGGRTGWFTGKILQSMAAPLARAAVAVEPYMPALAMLAQEGDTLGHINSPESVATLAKALKPEQRAKLMAHYRNQPDYLSAMMRATK